MSLVTGTAPPWEQINRRVVRTPTNPLDKSTVVSIYPRAFYDRKVTLEDSVYEIPPGSYENPSFLVVGMSRWWREIDEEQPLLEIPVSSIQIAHSLVVDYIAGMPDCDMGEKRPGLFYVPGEHTLKTLLRDHADKIELAKIRQRNWFSALIVTADSLWSRTNGNPLAINDLMRLAAQELGVKDKPWMQQFSTIALEACPACGQFRNPNFPVCSHCHTIVDVKKFESMGLKQLPKP